MLILISFTWTRSFSTLSFFLWHNVLFFVGKHSRHLGVVEDTRMKTLRSLYESIMHSSLGVLRLYDASPLHVECLSCQAQHIPQILPFSFHQFDWPISARPHYFSVCSSSKINGPILERKNSNLIFSEFYLFFFFLPNTRKTYSPFLSLLLMIYIAL